VSEEKEVGGFGFLNGVSLGQVADGVFVLCLNEGCCGGCDGILRRWIEAGRLV